MEISAKKIYDALVNMLNERDWNFRQDDEKLMIQAVISTDDLPVDFIMRVVEGRDVVQFRSVLPIKMPEDKRVEGAIAVSVANYGMINGSFDYDINDGEIVFRLTTSFTGTMLSDDLLEKMILIGSGTIDRYNDKFFMLAKGMMTLQQFIEKENE